MIQWDDVKCFYNLPSFATLECDFMKIPNQNFMNLVNLEFRERSNLGKVLFFFYVLWFYDILHPVNITAYVYYTDFN